jgi:hypothetical protein
MEDELSHRLRGLRPRLTWSSFVGSGSGTVWTREDDVWDLPAPPEDYALPPVMPWVEELRHLALRDHCARFDRFLEPNERHQMDWPPQGFLASAGWWYVRLPSCSQHGEDCDDSCDECRTLDRDGIVVIDQPAQWEWTVEIRTIERGKKSDGSTFETEVDAQHWILGYTDIDPREVEYGPEKGSPARSELIRAFWASETRTLERLEYHFASGEDGDRHLIIDDPTVDCGGWRLEVHEPDGTYVSNFEQGTVYGTSGATNFLGFGEERRAWMAYMEWGATEAHFMLPDGSRYPVHGFIAR